MARNRTTTAWRKVRVMAWNRDRKTHAPCHICGEPIDYSIPASSAPLSWEPDHLQPFSKCPELELDLNNIAPSHRQCNRQRGAGNSNNDLGRRSRIW